MINTVYTILVSVVSKLQFQGSGLLSDFTRSRLFSFSRSFISDFFIASQLETKLTTHKIVSAR